MADVHRARWPRILRKARWPALGVAALLAWARWWPMAPLFTAPTSTVLLDRAGGLLAATVARDGQWRMPAPDSVPARFARCLTEFEDRRFRRHWGISLPALARAARQNLAAGHVVSGGSTITMQVARLALRRSDRSTWSKLLEMVLALRLELRMGKDAILGLYAANAPFGGNVVGLEAASWRWFGKPSHELSWAESATLAVLPNAPARIHPGRNREALRAKRDRLLDRLLAVGAMDRMEWSLARQEPLPEAAQPLPRLAPHLLATLRAQGLEGQRITSTIDRALQQRIAALADRYAGVLNANEVHNAAVLVLDARSGEALAYVGNLTGAQEGGEVDLVQAPRSTGSLLKPFLYAAMLQAGERMPDQLVADLPTSFDGFAPRNYDGEYAGAVPASAALARSLNVPAVRALREHGVERTRRMLVAMGLRHLSRSAEHYGLSLIVGGGEGTLWELTGAYASLERVLMRYTGSAASVEGAVHDPTAVLGRAAAGAGPPPLGPGAIHHALVALQEVNRPESESGWQHFARQQRIAWKTGTSYGHRDAWAIGLNGRYAVGVWTGNASGEGRPGLTGTLAAAPLLFDAFAALPEGHAREVPHDALETMEVCPESGFRAGPDCPRTERRMVLHEAVRTPPCPYHVRILVDASGTRRARPGEGGHAVAWFNLPPAMEHYYQRGHPGYRPLPPAAGGMPEGRPMQMIYPEQGATIFLPVLLDGEPGRLVMRAAHARPDAQLHWDLDGRYLGTTTAPHQWAASLAEGRHRITLTDEEGARAETDFRTVSRRAR